MISDNTLVKLIRDVNKDQHSFLMYLVLQHHVTCIGPILLMIQI